MARPISKVAPGWWDYTTLDPHLLADAAKLTADDLLPLSRDGFSTLCAFTHAPSHFIRHGFSMVPHPWLPEKIQTDCYNCPKFRTCEQYAMALALKGGSLRTSAAGQRPYLAMPPNALSTVDLTGIELKGTGRVQ